jgi:hypothetical protein
MNSILYLREIGNNFHCINEYIIISFYIYGKIRESFYLIEITAEIHDVNIFKLKILIAIDIVDIKKRFIDFRIRTLAIDIISEFNTNIRAIRRNTKIIKMLEATGVCSAKMRGAILRICGPANLVRLA